MLQVPGDVAFSALISVIILIFYCRTWMAALVKCRNFSCPSFPDVRNFHHKVVPKRIANTIHFWAANETKLHIKSLIPNHFFVILKERNEFFGICEVYINKNNYSPPCWWNWWSFTMPLHGTVNLHHYSPSHCE